MKLVNIHGKLQALEKLVEKTAAVLHMAFLEAHGPQKEKPEAIECKSGKCLCMEPDTNGGLVSSSKPHPENDNHLSQTEETRLYRYAGNLSPNQVNVASRVIRVRTYGGVRGAP